MALFYVGSGVHALLFPAFYQSVMPPYLPAPATLAFASAVIKIGLGLAVLFPATRRLACWSIVAMLVVFMPVHVHMVANPHLFPQVPVPLLWLRLPLQLLFALWAGWHALTPRR